MPERVVTDLHDGQLRAVAKLWPQTELYLCEWHLQHALERLFDQEKRRNPQHSADIDGLRPRIERAFDGIHFWRPFVRDVRAASILAFDRWLDEMSPIIEDQFRRRGPAMGRPPNMPLTTGGLDQMVRPVKHAIHERRFGFKNRERLNRLLMLMQLHINGQDSQLAYTTAIRDWLLANDGRPRVPRRAIADRKGTPSLRR